MKRWIFLYFCLRPGRSFKADMLGNQRKIIHSPSRCLGLPSIPGRIDEIGILQRCWHTHRWWRRSWGLTPKTGPTWSWATEDLWVHCPKIGNQCVESYKHMQTKNTAERITTPWSWNLAPKLTQGLMAVTNETCDSNLGFKPCLWCSWHKNFR